MLTVRNTTALYWFLVALLTVTTYSHAHNLTDSSSGYLPYNISRDCKLSPTDRNLESRIKALQNEETKLLAYKLSIQGYDTNPLLVNMTHNFKADHWHRVFHHHGHALLSLVFNYGMLSLSLLKIGVEHMDIEIQDEPKGCLKQLDEDDKIALVQDLLMRDFSRDTSGVPTLRKNNFVCHEVLSIHNDEGHFVDKCCSFNPNHHNLECREEEAKTILNVMYYFLLAIKFGFLLFGPLVLQSWIYFDQFESIKEIPYVLPLSEPIQVTKDVAKKFDLKSNGKQTESGHLEYSFHTLHMLVDQDQLMTEHSVPVGFFRFIIEKILRCRISDKEPFKAFCNTSILGEDVPNCGMKCCKWRHLFMVLGDALAFGMISLPYFVRAYIFFQFEDPEVQQRNQALENMEVDVIIHQNVFHYLTPIHPVLVATYILYAISFFAIAVMRRCFAKEFDSLVRPALEDLFNVSYFEAIRMTFSPLVVPLKKFGIFGVIVSVVYFPIALCLCSLAFVVYYVPTLYITWGFLIRCSTKSSCNKQASDIKHPGLCIRQASDNENLLISRVNSVKPVKVRAWLKFGIGICCTIYMFALLMMYAEVFGFLAEMLFLTVMGVIVNASTAHQYLMLVFWMIMYVTNCFNKVYKDYFRVNQKIFEYLKEKLEDEVRKYTIMKKEMQENYAFKYFTQRELDDLNKARLGRKSIRPIETSDDDDDDAPHTLHSYFTCCSKPDGAPQVTGNCEDIPNDKLIEDDDQLQWKGYSLVLFVDKKDVPRIPKTLFYDIAEQELVGCPGPIYKSLANAIKRIIYLTSFLAFVFLIILLVAIFYGLSSTNQFLLTTVSGFIPVMISKVFLPKVEDNIDLNTYTFHGRIQELLRDYEQSWPVHTLEQRDETETIKEMVPHPYCKACTCTIDDWGAQQRSTSKC